MMPGETILTGASPKCCGKVLLFRLLKSPAGWYVGTFCPKCGPYSRETIYIQDQEEGYRVLMSFQNWEEGGADQSDLKHINQYAR